MHALHLRPFSSSPTATPKLRLTKSLDYSPLRPHSPQNPLTPDDQSRLPSPHANPYDKMDEASRRLAVTRALREAFDDEHLTFEDLTDHRAFVCWRIVRELGRQMGLFVNGESIEDSVSQIIDRSTIDSPRPNPWTENVTYAVPTLSTRTCPELVRTIIRARELPAEAYPYLSILRQEHTKDQTPLGLGVLPPTIPMSALDLTTEEAKADYDPENPDADPLFHLYLKAVHLVVDHLDLYNANPENEPDHNRYGLISLFEPHLIRHIFATPSQIVEAENRVIEETLISMVARGNARTLKFLHTQYGLHRHEAEAMLSCARSRATDLVQFDIDSDRAVMAMKLEDVARRSREALDLRTELMALKALGVVQGLARAEPDDAFKEFTTIVKTVTSDRKRVENTSPALPPPMQVPLAKPQGTKPGMDLIDVLERASTNGSDQKG